MTDPWRRRRLLAAVGAAIALLALLPALSGTTLFVYNGLARAVLVTVDGEPLELLQHQAGQLPVRCLPGCDIETRTQDGVLVEAFREHLLPGAGDGARVYNVAAASPLLLRRQPDTTDHEQSVPLQRWLAVPAGQVFGMAVAGAPAAPAAPAPVLTGAGDLPPRELLGLAPTADDQLKVALVQARWAAADAQYADQWLQLLAHRKELPGLLQARLADDPEDPPALRQLRTNIAPAPDTPAPR